MHQLEKRNHIGTASSHWVADGLRRKEIKGDKEVDFETFFKKCKLNPNAHLITGTICGYRIEDLESPLSKQARFMDKLVDELAKGRKMKKCCAPKK